MAGYDHQSDRAENTEELKKKLNDIQTALDASTIVAITDARGVILEVNQKFCEISGYDDHELVGRTHRILNSGYHPKAFFKEMWETILQGRIWSGEIRNQAKDGRIYWTSSTIIPIRDRHRRIERFFAIRHDISDRVSAELKLKQALEDDYRIVIQHLHNGVFKLKRQADGSHVFTMSEGLIAEKLKRTTDAVYGKTIYEIFDKAIATRIDQAFKAAMASAQSRFELTIQNRHYLVNIGVIREDAGDAKLAGSIVDITEQTRQARQIHRMAYFDELTGLPNRRSFEQEVDRRKAAETETDHEMAVLLVNLDRFQSINETLGHRVGDELLQEIAKRLGALLEEGDFLARFTGDEFAIVMACRERRQREREYLHYRCSVLVEYLAKAYIVRGMEIHTTTSIGVGLYPDHAQERDELIQSAEAAISSAKEQGGNTFVLFNASIRNMLDRRILIEGELRKEASRDQLYLVYQAKVDAKTRNLCGFEALLRWRHPILGELSPAEFIPVAEKSGLIISLGQWVLKNSIDQVKRWHQAGHVLPVSINISVQQFTQSDFADFVSEQVTASAVDPAMIELEVTETVTENPQLTRTTMRKLKEVGVMISMDDFGTGYSSLGFLDGYPFDRIKIDKSFIINLSEENCSVVRTIIQLAKNLNMTVTAEGVETEAHADFLTREKCDELQGFYFSKPLPASDTERIWLSGSNKQE